MSLSNAFSESKLWVIQSGHFRLHTGCLEKLKREAMDILLQVLGGK
jgi:hypothetical protein